MPKAPSTAARVAKTASASGRAALGDHPVKVDAALLREMPRQPLTAQEQAAAIKRAKEQAQTRIALGKKLLEAASTRLTQQHEALQAIRTEQQQLRDRLQQDVAQSLQQYDQWLGHADERFTQRIESLEERMTRMETVVMQSAKDIQKLLQAASKQAPAAKEPVDAKPTPPSSDSSEAASESEHNPDVLDGIIDQLRQPSN